MMTLLALLSALVLHAQKDSLALMFWNVENFFDYRSPDRPEYWTRRRFYSKCDAIAKIILRFADRYGTLPDVVALAEVENSSVLRSLLRETPLRKLDYSIVHFDSPDRRGIDCALLYRRSSLSLSESFPVHIRDGGGEVMATRDILVARFSEGISVLVNHHPSKIGGKSDRRRAAFARMEETADSLLRAGAERVLCVGDFNDCLWADGRPGTIKYNGEWEKIDGFFSFGDISVREEVFADRLLLTEDRTFGGEKPRRTFTGPKYEGGVSDHLPVALFVSF